MPGKFGITVLGSGSRGNAAVIHGPEGNLLLDAGFTARELERRLSSREIAADSIRAVLLTHDHSDHTKGCRVFADRHHIAAYMTAPTLQEGRRTNFLPEQKFLISPGTAFDLCGVKIEPDSIRAVVLTHDHSDHTKGCRVFADRHRISAYMTAPTLHEGRQADFLPERKVLISPGTAFDLCGVKVEPFTVPHDAAATIGCVFHACERKIGVATDLGHVTLLVRQKLHGCSLLVLEANHDPGMLFASSRHVRVKRRIFSREGHLSNADAMAALEDLLSPECRALVLAHISSECNDRELLENMAEKTLQNLGRTDILLHIAKQDSPLDTFWLAG